MRPPVRVWNERAPWTMDRYAATAAEWETAGRTMPDPGVFIYGHNGYWGFGAEPDFAIEALDLLEMLL